MGIHILEEIRLALRANKVSGHICNTVPKKSKKKKSSGINLNNHFHNTYLLE
jgi:hypothetical protein